MQMNKWKKEMPEVPEIVHNAVISTLEVIETKDNIVKKGNANMKKVLSQYDDERTLEALSFLKEYAKNSQVVLFTCHNSITEAAKGLEIEAQPLKH